MRKIITQLLWVALLGLPGIGFAQIQLWVGSSSSSWNDPLNWIPFDGGYPDSPTDFAVIGMAIVYSPVLSTPITLAGLTTSAGAAINLNGQTISIVGTGGTINGTTINSLAPNPGVIKQMNISGSLTFINCSLSNFTLEKSSATPTSFQGGNFFSSPTLIDMKAGSGNTIMGLISGDMFNGQVQFKNGSSSSLQIAENGASTFTGNILLEQTGNGEIVFGSGGGSSTLSFGAIQGANLQGGEVKLNKVMQSNPSANAIGSMMGSPANLSLTDCEFVGSFTARASASISITSSKFFGLVNSFEAPRFAEVKQSRFVNGGTSTEFKKTAAATISDAWHGGNRYDNFQLVNESNYDVRLNASERDTFFYPATFSNTGAGFLWAAATDSCHFASHVFLNNSSVKGIRLGATATGFTTINGNLKTSGFSNGPLELRKLRQIGSSSNDLFNPASLLVNTAHLEGDFSCAGSTTITLESSIFNRNNGFSSANITNVSACTFSDIMGTATTFTKTGGGLNIWSGGNSFGEVVFVNESPNAFRLSNAAVDTFTRKATFKRMAGAGPLNPCNGADCHFKGDISTEGTAAQVLFGGASSGTAIINGNTLQRLFGDTPPRPQFRRLEINSTGTFELMNQLALSGTCTFTNGVIKTTNANRLVFVEGSFSPVTGSAMSYVDGPIRRLSNDAITSFTFPVGKNGKFAPVTISKIAGADVFGTFQVEYFDGPGPNTSMVNVPISHVSECEYWDINRIAGSEPVNVTINWDDVRSCGITQPNDLTIARWDGSTWTNLGGTVIGALPSGTITATGVGSFSPFTLGSTQPRPVNPLPIELLFFSAKPNGKVVDLTWATATEKDNEYFTVERSSDGIRFEPLLHVPGAGNSTETLHYYETDEKPLPGISYYRLRQTDFNGDFSFSNIAAVQMPLDDKTFAVYPNPASGHFLLETGADITQLRYRLLNSMGQTMPVAPAAEAGRLRFSTQGLPAGLYFLEVQYRNEAQTLKVIVR